MFRIANTLGQVLDLDPDVKITNEKNCSLFNESDKLIQDKSQQFKVAMTPNNKRFMKMAHLVEASNDVYRQDVEVKFQGDTFLTGKLKCSIQDGDYLPNLEPNLVAINALFKDIYLSDIIVYDGVSNLSNYTDLTDLMLDTVVNPDKHPFIFIPVLNRSLNPGFQHPAINYFDQDLQKFRVTEVGITGKQSPYYKVTYILKVIAEYLSLTPVGGFFTDEQTKNIVIYTPLIFTDHFIWPSTKFMPGMLLADFLKQIRERMHVAIDFDLTRGEMSVESFASIANTEARDISAYVTSYNQELPDTTGYTVTLKSDESDQEFAVEVDETTTYPPLYQLTVGDGSTPVELDCSTLKANDESTGAVRGKRFVSVNLEPFQPVNELAGLTDNTDFKQFNLRLFQFLGFNEITPGKFYPESAAYDLNGLDEKWFQFTNDSRRHTITANVPPAELAQWKTTCKYTYRSKNYNYCDVIFEKFSYDFGPKTKLIPVKIYARALNFEASTTVAITTVNTAPDADYTYQDGVSIFIDALVKAYFDPALHGIEQVDFNFVVTIGDPDHVVIDPVYKSKPVLFAANTKGSGGKPANTYRLSSALTGDNQGLYRQELRVYSGHPQYMVCNGIRYSFSQRDDYYYVTVGIQLQQFIGDYYTIFY